MKTEELFTLNEIPRTHIKDGITWAYDIRGQYKDLPRKMGMPVDGVIMHYAGDISLYLSKAYSDGATTLRSVLDAIEHLYYPLHEIEGGEINPETLEWKYPEDPTLTPIITARSSLMKGDTPVNVTIAVYVYSIVYIEVNGESYVTRID